MPEVGVLNLEIRDNSSEAGKGLSKLAGALLSVKQALGGDGGIGLSPLVKDITDFSNEIKGAIPAIKILNDFGKSMSALSKVKSFSLKAADFESLKNAVSGFNIGNIGSQLNQLRLAVAGKWGEEGSNKATDSINSIATAASNLSSNNAAGVISDVAKAINEYASAVKNASDTFGTKDMMAQTFGVSQQDMASIGNNTGTDYANAGMDSAEGLEIGMEQGRAGVVGAAIDLAVTALEAIKSELGIASPSKKFRQIGEFVGEGFIEGIRSKIPGARKAMEDMTSTSGDIIEPWMGGSAFDDSEFEDFAASVQSASDSFEQAEVEDPYWFEDFGNGIEDGVERINDAFNNADLEDGNWLDELEEDKAAAQSAAGGFDEAVDEIEEARRRFEEEWMSSADGTNPLEGAMDSMSDSADEASASLTQYGQEVQESSETTMTFKDFLNEAKDAAKEFGSSLVQSIHDVGGLKGALQKMFPTLSGLLKRFQSVAKMRALRYIIRQITSGISEGVENMYQYSKSVGTDFAPTMDNAASSLLQFKNSIGAAVSPLISSFIPVLQTVISWLIEGINYINQFFALLNGQSTWTKAVYTQTDAYKDNTKNAKAAAKEAKDLLADWDELNIIQSESGGGGGGGSNKPQTDYASMFEEVSDYNETIRDLVDFIRDNTDKIWSIIKKIGVALLAWKVSSAFTGLLGTLASIVAAGAIIGITLDIVTMLDNKYADTGEEGWLIADILTTALGATLAGGVIAKVLGGSAGLITAGITFALSAGATFAVASDVEDQARKSTLDILAIAKLAFSAILTTAGLAAAGLSVGVAIGGGILITGLAATIMWGVTMDAEQRQSAREQALAAFAAGDDGRAKIDPDEYISELQTVLNELTANSTLVVGAYLEVPDLKGKYDAAIEQLKALNTVISGTDKLTQEDADAFRNAWVTVVATLDTMNSKTYDTLLQGLNASLANAVGDAKQKVLELRTLFVQEERDLDADLASLYTEMQDIVDKIANGTATDEDLSKYESLWRVFSGATNSAFQQLQDVIDQGATLDFSNSETPLEDAQAYIDSVKKMADEANKTFDDALNATKDSIKFKKELNERLFSENLIDEDTYNKRNDMYDQILATVTESTERQKGEVQKKIQDAYNLMFETAFSGNLNSEAYWTEVIGPLLQQAKEAGAEIPVEFAKYVTEGMKNSKMSELPADFIVGIVSDGFGDMSAETIAEEINRGIRSELEEHPTDFIQDVASFFGAWSSKNNEILNVADMIGFEGFDYLTDELKVQLADAIRAAFPDKAEDILKELGYDFNLDFTKLSRDEIANLMQSLSSGGNVDMLNRPVIRNDDGSISTLITQAFTASADGSEGIQWNQDLVLNVTPITPDGEVLDNNTLDSYIEDLLGKSTNINELFWNDKVENGGKGLLINAVEGFSTFEEGLAKAKEIAEQLHVLQDLYYSDQQPQVPELDTTALDRSCKNARASVSGMTDSIKQSIKDMNGLGFSFDLSNGESLTGNMNVRIPVTTAATGAVVKSGDLVMANENGNFEMMGRMGSQPVIANNQQIVNGISQGVATANSGVENRLNTIENLLTRLLNKEFVARAVPSSGWGRNNAQSNAAWDKVTG